MPMVSWLRSAVIMTCYIQMYCVPAREFWRAKHFGNTQERYSQPALVVGVILCKFLSIKQQYSWCALWDIHELVHDKCQPPNPMKSRFSYMCAYVLCMFWYVFYWAPSQNPSPTGPRGTILVNQSPQGRFTESYSYAVIFQIFWGCHFKLHKCQLWLHPAVSHPCAEANFHHPAAMLSSFLRDSPDVTKDDDDHHCFDTFNNPVFCLKYS